jgi:hypothetical protein
MKTKSVYIWVRQNGTINSKATITVPGLGEVDIEHALSDALSSAIIAETIAALRVKLGQVISTDAVPNEPNLKGLNRMTP